MTASPLSTPGLQSHPHPAPGDAELKQTKPRIASAIPCPHFPQEMRDEAPTPSPWTCGTDLALHWFLGTLFCAKTYSGDNHFRILWDQAPVTDNPAQNSALIKPGKGLAPPPAPAAPSCPDLGIPCSTAFGTASSHSGIWRVLQFMNN